MKWHKKLGEVSKNIVKEFGADKLLGIQLEDAIAVDASNNTFFPSVIAGIVFIYDSVGVEKPFSGMTFWMGFENEENSLGCIGDLFV